MTHKQALDWAQRKLLHKGIPTARLDALVLLEDNTRRNRAQILAEPHMTIDVPTLIKFKSQVIRRSQQYPLAYIRGKSEFYGREFIVNRHVLEPRPESEVMITIALNRLNGLNKVTVVDIGTGSGALIITLKLELSKINAFATDISRSSINLAQRNSQSFGTNIHFFCGNLLEPLPKSLWENNVMLVANLPYVPLDWQINPPAMREPKIAIFGGQDGLSVYRQLFQQLNDLDHKPMLIATEAMPPQHTELVKIAKTGGYELLETDDFIQLFGISMTHPQE